MGTVRTSSPVFRVFEVTFPGNSVLRLAVDIGNLGVGVGFGSIDVELLGIGDSFGLAVRCGGDDLIGGRRRRGVSPSGRHRIRCGFLVTVAVRGSGLALLDRALNLGVGRGG